MLPVNVNHPRLKKVQELVRAGNPNHYRRCVGHIPETLFAFAQRGFGPPALGDVVNRSNQMGTSAFVVKDRRDPDFAGQPPGRVIRCFFPTHDGIFFDRLSVLSQNHRQGRLRDDLVHRFADHLLPGSVR